MFGRTARAYLDGLAALPIRVFGGVRFDHWAGVLHDFAILEHHLALDARLDLLGGGQLGGRLFDHLLCNGLICENELNLCYVS